MSGAGRPPKTFSKVERDWIADNLGRLSVREMADRLDRPKSTVGREVVRVRAEVGLPMPPDPRYPDRAFPDPPEDTEARLLEIARTLRAAMLSADEKNLARIASEYRSTVVELSRIQGQAAKAGARQANDAGLRDPGDTFLSRMWAKHRGDGFA